MSLIPVTISMPPDSTGYTVTQGNRFADRLNWDEMIGQVINLTHPSIRRQHSPMRTEAEHRFEKARRELRAAEVAVERERVAVPDELSRVTGGAL